MTPVNRGPSTAPIQPTAMAASATTGLPRVAIAHDYLTQRGGAERVVLALSEAFPEAPIYTTLYEPDATYPEFAERHIISSPLNRVPFLRRHHRAALPFLPWAINRLPIDADVVIASSSGWAHGVPTTGRTLVYCHAPARWLYQPQNYLGSSGLLKRAALSVLRSPLARWDARQAARADHYLANSTTVREAIEQIYGIRADRVCPPAGIDMAGPQEPIEGISEWADERGYLLVVSRLMPYKNVDLVIEAARSSNDRLLIIGDGPLWAQLHAQVGDTEQIALRRGLSDAQMRWAYAHARLLVAPSIEDFGLTPVEAGIFGVPTVALRAGGYLDTVADGISGAFFDEPTPAAISAAIAQADRAHFPSEAVKKHVEQFSAASFREQIRAHVLKVHNGDRGETVR